MTPTGARIKQEYADLRRAAFQKHRAGADSLEVVHNLSDGVDALLFELFEEVVGEGKERMVMLPVGGYGRRELCPRSDVDLLFIRTADSRGEGVERLVRLLWDGGFQLGHAVRTVKECYEYMRDDLVTANAVLESRYLAGSRTLEGDLRQDAVDRYCRRHRESFIAAKFALLRKSLEDPHRTIYVVEPSLKEGVCGLRDIQRVLWIENMKHGTGIGFEAIMEESRFPPADFERVRDAYRFFLRLRCELHFTNEVRQDILERDSMLPVARALGYSGRGDAQRAVESLMEDYYRHARHVARFLWYYLEVSERPAGLLGKIHRRLTEERIRPWLTLYRGRVLIARDAEDAAADGSQPLPEKILDLFLAAQEKDAQLSETLAEWLRSRVAELEADAFQTPGVCRAFRALLQRGRCVGRLLKSLHDTGILARIIPEFSALTCLVNFDGHHQFTVDEHTLKTLEELDRIETDSAYPEREFREVFEEIKDPLPLRLALLLHDTGKATPGEHAVSGTEAATLFCERIGLDEKVIETVDFLIYRHLELFRVSELRDFTQSEVIESLAKLVKTEERLKMLYLLTYIDVVSVGPGTWTQWKGAQLSELYQRTRIHLLTGSTAQDTLEVRLSSLDVDAPRRDELVEHCRLMDGATYGREILPERMLYHVDLVKRFQEKGEMQVAVDSRPGYVDITFCGSDRPRLFADLTGLLFSEGFNVLGARIYSRSDGIAIDLFQVEIADTVQVGAEARVDRVRQKLRRVESRKLMVEDFIRQRTLSYRPRRWRKPLFGPRVTFDNESSSTCSVIEVSAGDRPGLLYDLAQALHALGLDLRTAKVSTSMDRAHDAFYVVERDGTKVDNAARRSEIAQLLKAHAERPAAALSRGGRS